MPTDAKKSDPKVWAGRHAPTDVLSQGTTPQEALEATIDAVELKRKVEAERNRT